MIIRSRAPVRIDFAGGWTDVALFAQEEPGAVVNAAINLYSYVTVKKLPSKRVESKAYGYQHYQTVEDKMVKIYSADFDVYQEAEDIKKLEYNGNIDLSKAALKTFNIDCGVEIITRSNAPAGSGLGTSAAMGVALVGALSCLNCTSLLPYELAEMASFIEREELGIRGGKQDQYASALGGLNFMEFYGEDVKYSSMRLNPRVQYELEKSLVLCYTGKSRLSGDIHLKVANAYLGGDNNTRTALSNLKRIARDTKSVLLEGDLQSFGKPLDENWQNQKLLHPATTNSQMDRIFEIAYSAGTLGGKASGAGGGGCLFFYCIPDKEHLVRKQLENAGVEIIDFNFDFDGLQIWESEGLCLREEKKS